MGRADVDGDVSHFSGKRLLQSRVNAYVLASITSSQSAHPALNTSILLFSSRWHSLASVRPAVSAPVVRIGGSGTTHTQAITFALAGQIFRILPFNVKPIAFALPISFDRHSDRARHSSSIPCWPCGGRWRTAHGADLFASLSLPFRAG
jgi:hypothetical protein